MFTKIALGLSVLAFAGLAASVVARTEWMVRGEAVVTCPCKVPCPCRSNAHASQPHCENLSYVHIVQGRYGRTRLNGLQYIWAADECQGGENARKATQLYFPNAATEAEVSAVEKIMSGEHCTRTAAKGVTVARGDLTAHVAGSLYSVQIPRLLQLQVDLAPGPTPMEPLPALDSWGNTVTYVRNIKAQINDSRAGLKWDYSGLQANYRTFEITSDMVERGLLLAQFRDDAGHFNEMHRSLIQEQHLQVPLNREEFGNMLAQVHGLSKPAYEVAADAPYGSIGGLVSGSDGHPKSGTRLRLIQEEHAVGPIAVANAAGRYFISRVPTGAYRLCAVSWDGKQQEQSCESVSVARGEVVEHRQTLTAVSR